jgi:DNA-binding transcriptional LysR family regulator
MGSVKQAAAELQVSEAAVSLHIGQLRKELGDKLFTRTAAGIAFTPGGLRLASRAAELLGLQDRTILEVSQAGRGRRLLRVAASSLFAEHSAPGLIELFAGRAHDLDVELSVHSAGQFERLLRTRAVDVAIGPSAGSDTPDPALASAPLLNYQVVVVAGPDDPITKVTPTVRELQERNWLLGPSAADHAEVVAAMLRRLQVPESRQQIFQSQAAALEEAKRGKGVTAALGFAVSQDLAKGDLVRLAGQQVVAPGTWHIRSLQGDNAASAAAEFIRFAATPRATQAMLRGAGVTVGRFRPSIHVTLWS